MPRRVSEIEQLRRERDSLKRQLKQLENKLASERKRRQKKKLRLTTKKIKNQKQRATNLRRSVKSIADAVKRFRKRKTRQPGTPKQRRQQGSKHALKTQKGQKYGEQKVWNFNGYNESGNFNSISGYLNSLRQRGHKDTIRVRINVDAMFRGKPSGETAIKLKGGPKRYGFSVFSANLKNPTIQDVHSFYGTLNFDRIIAPFSEDIVRNSKTGQLRIFKVIVTATIT